jgi:hypothetical protein
MKGSLSLVRPLYNYALMIITFHTGRMGVWMRNWRSLAAAVCLWFAYLFICAAYSLFAPFLPKEVWQAGPWNDSHGHISHENCHPIVCIT